MRHFLTANQSLSFLMCNLMRRRTQSIFQKSDVNRLRYLFDKRSRFYTSLDDFISNEIPQSLLPIAHNDMFYNEMNNQFQIGKKLQEAIFLEFLAIITIANRLNLINMESNESGFTSHLPSKYSNARYIFFDGLYETFLIHLGQPDEVDMILYHNGVESRFDIKDEFAKLGEHDVENDSQGNLIITDKIRSEKPFLIPMISYFTNNVGSYFNINGSNWNQFPSEICYQAGLDYYRSKDLDAFIVIDSNSILLPIPLSLMNECFDFSTSEIRGTGKNPYKVYDPIYRDRVLRDLNAQINDNMVTIPQSNLYATRYVTGTDVVSGIKLNPHFIVRSMHYQIEGDSVVFNIKNIKQIKTTISPKVRLAVNYTDLYNILLVDEDC